MSDSRGRHGEEDEKRKEALIQHHGPVKGRAKSLFSQLFGGLW